MRANIRRFDARVIDGVMSLPPPLKPFWLVVTTLGHPIVAITIGAVIVFTGRVEASTQLVLSGGMIWAALAIGSLLKLLFGRARPVTDYAAGIWLDKLSFPSGHATGSTIAYGLLAYFALQLLPDPWNYVVASVLTALIVLIGISRVYLGAHFPSDVIAGWLLGSGVLFIVIFFITPLAGT